SPRRKPDAYRPNEGLERTRMHPRPWRRPSPAMVVACVALFVALGGTTSAAIIVSSNGQVARHTISGHAPPAGDHPNVISRSLTTADIASLAITRPLIAPNSIGGGKVVDHSLTGADINA